MTRLLGRTAAVLLFPTLPPAAIAAAPTAANTQGYASRARANVNTTVLSTAAPVRNARAAGSSRERTRRPNDHAARTVNAAPKKIASASNRYSENPAREIGNPKVAPSIFDVHILSVSM